MDVRLTVEGGLLDLVERVTEAFPDEEDIRAADEVLNFHRGKLKAKQTDNKWQEIILLMDDQNRLDEFFRYVQQKGGGHSNRISRILAWSSKAAELQTVSEAARECKRLLSDIMSTNDPRQTEVQLVSLSGAVKQITVALALPKVAGMLFGLAPNSDSIARAAVSSARQASSNVDQLLIGLGLANSAVSRIASSAPASDAFSVPYMIVGQLLGTRARLDESMTDLLNILMRANPASFNHEDGSGNGTVPE